MKQREWIQWIRELLVRRRGSKAGVSAWQAAFFVAFIATLALMLNYFVMQLPVLQKFYAESGGGEPFTWAPLFLRFLLIAVVMPFVEELVFRGVLCNLLEQRFGALAAVLLSSLIFGLAHGEPMSQAYACVLGACLAAGYLRFGSVGLCWAAHAMANGLVFAWLHQWF